MKFAHVINPVKVGTNSDLFIAQPVTFETQKIAKESAINAEVELFSINYPEDDEIVPSHYQRLPHLERSILDVAAFEEKRKLPVLADILQRLYDATDAEYLIYTNVDIALQPNFYDKAAEFVEAGYNGIVINRRTINDRFRSVDEIPEMHKDKGKKHPGYDCFIFPREHFPDYLLGTACIGSNWIGRVLIANLMAHSDNFCVFTDEHLTFHIGDDLSWRRKSLDDYHMHNEVQLFEILGKLLNNEKSHNRHLLSDFYGFHSNRLNKLSIPDNIKDLNRINRNLPLPPEKIYYNYYIPDKPADKCEVEPLVRQDPIFIVGFPRSGTTLIQSLICTQEGIISLPETHAFSGPRNRLKNKNKDIPPEVLIQLIELLRKKIPFSRQAEEQSLKMAESEGLSFKMFFENLLIDHFIGKYQPETIKNYRWVEKTPVHLHNIPYILRVYPGAKIIYMIRHPEKAIISRRKNFGFNKEEHTWPISKHASKWLHSVMSARQFAMEYPGKIYILRLEDLVKDTEKEMKKVCNFLDIEFRKDLLKNKDKVSEGLFFHWEFWKHGVKSEISDNISGRKRDHLPFVQRSTLFLMLFPLMLKYKYSPFKMLFGL